MTFPHKSKFEMLQNPTSITTTCYLSKGCQQGRFQCLCSAKQLLNILFGRQDFENSIAACKSKESATVLGEDGCCRGLYQLTDPASAPQ